MTRNALCTKVNKNIYYLLLICYTIYESKRVVFMKNFKRVIIVVCCLLFISFLLTSYALYYKKRLILNISSINITKISTDKKVLKSLSRVILIMSLNVLLLMIYINQKVCLRVGFVYLL